MQELQRLQEESTGRKRTEKLEWMYATPATGSSANKNDLEDYLLGKKRVDKLLIGDENEKVRCSVCIFPSFSDVLTHMLVPLRSEPRIRTSLPCRMPTRRVTSLQRFAKILSLRSSSKNKPLIKL